MNYKIDNVLERMKERERLLEQSRAPNDKARYFVIVESDGQHVWKDTITGQLSDQVESLPRPAFQVVGTRMKAIKFERPGELPVEQEMWYQPEQVPAASGLGTVPKKAGWQRDQR